MLHQHCVMDLLLSPLRYLLDYSFSKLTDMKLVLATLIHSSPILEKKTYFFPIKKKVRGDKGYTYF